MAMLINKTAGFEARRISKYMKKFQSGEPSMLIISVDLISLEMIKKGVS